MSEDEIKSVSKINQILDSSGVKLEASLDHQGDLRIGEISFKKLLNPLMSEVGTGVILTNSSEELRKILKSKGISFIDTNGNLFLNSSSGQITVVPKLKTIAFRQAGISLTSHLPMLNPTNLISPIGLSIIDTLMRMSDSELNELGSALQFCNRYRLSQSKLNLTMRRLHARTLVEFKYKIREIPLEWWFFAFESPSTKRKMVNFFEAATPYHSLLPDMNYSDSKSLLRSIEYEFPFTTPGPTEVAKAFGEIVDNDISLWISDVVESRIKRQFKLIPGKKEGLRTWMLATVPEDVLQDSIITHDAKTKNICKTNIIRSIWDLGYGESRLREVREKMLKVFVYENR